MPDRKESSAEVEKQWRAYLTTGDVPGYFITHGFRLKDLKHFFRAFPTDPRCRMCYVPFKGAGGWVARHLLDRAPSRLNPTICDVCDQWLARTRGGAEVELTMLFADVRGSTTLAEGMGATEFGSLIDRFYSATTHVLIHADAMIEKLIGDEVAAFFVPGFAGQQHARRAIQAGQEILRVTGHGGAAAPWMPVGIGVHTGVAFVGIVGSQESVSEITVLGDTVNIAARLAAQAGTGEMIVSQATAQAAGLPETGEPRRLQLKGRSEPVDVLVMKGAGG